MADMPEELTLSDGPVSKIYPKARRVDRPEYVNKLTER